MKSIAALACISCLFQLQGCASASREMANAPCCSKLTLLVATNYVSGATWRLGLLPDREAQVALERVFSFRVGNNYSMAHLSKEITRTTGKRVVWCPESAGEMLR